MSLSELHHIIAADVNRIVSESQLAFILKTLNNTGLVSPERREKNVYFALLFLVGIYKSGHTLPICLH